MTENTGGKGNAENLATYLIQFSLDVQESMEEKLPKKHVVRYAASKKKVSVR